jgi:hypothetical protein
MIRIILGNAFQTLWATAILLHVNIMYNYEYRMLYNYYYTNMFGIQHTPPIYDYIIINYEWHTG